MDKFVAIMLVVWFIMPFLYLSVRLASVLPESALETDEPVHHPNRHACE